MKSDIAILNESSLVLSKELEDQLEKVVLFTLASEGIEAVCEISILFCENEQIHRLNLEYREKDRPTDVLSFPLYESREELLEEANADSIASFFALGDVVIAPDVVRAAAEEIGDSFEMHLCRMCIHSVLHLLGYDHETSPEEEAEMLGKQEEILRHFYQEA